MNVIYLSPPVSPVMQAASGAPLQLPLYANRVAAGFPSPAEGDVETSLDLNSYLIHHPAATYYVRVKGDSMIGAGIHDGDLLVVDRSLTPALGNIVLAVIDGDVTVKRLRQWNGRYILQAENPLYPAIPVPEDRELAVWGVVTSVIHKLMG